MTYSLYNDHLMGPAYASSQSYYSDSDRDRDSPFRRPSSPYPLHRSAISRLRNPHFKCTRNLGWNIDWAVAYLVNHLKKTKTDTAETLRNIRIKATTLLSEGLAPEDIVYKIFNRLDATLFAGHLKDAIYLSTAPLPRSLSGATYTADWGPEPDVSRISIVVNTDILEYARARDVVALLIHQMIHAYFLVACGPQQETEVGYGRLAHDNHFGMILMTIQEISATHGKELVGLDFRHSLYDEYPLRRRSSGKEGENAKWYCTHCHFSTTPLISPRDVEKWYNKTISPLLSPTLSLPALRSANVQIYNARTHGIETRARARLPSSTETIEVIYGDTSTLVEREMTEQNVHSARRALIHSRWLKIDEKDVDEAMFTRFLEFVHVGSYRAPPSYGSGNRRGELVLAPTAGHAHAENACILADVRFIKFATAMRFEECVSYGSKRLDLYNVVDEDPIAILTEIFSGREPSTKLRAWVARFLRATSSSPNFNGFGSHVEQTNLARLESPNGPWRARFLDAVDGSGGLENEVRKARDHIIKSGVWDASTSLPLQGLNQLRITGGGVGMAQNSLTSGLPLNSPGLLASGLQHQQQHQQLLLSGIQGLTSPSFLPSLANLNLLTSLPYNPHDINILSSSAFQLGQFKLLERQKVKELERERGRLRELEREKGRVKKTAAQLQIANALEEWYGKGIGFGTWGYVEEDSEDYD
jgi:hypothetical protein